MIIIDKLNQEDFFDDTKQNNDFSEKRQSEELQMKAYQSSYNQYNNQNQYYNPNYNQNQQSNQNQYYNNRLTSRYDEPVSTLEWFLHIFLIKVTGFGLVYSLVMIFTMKDVKEMQNFFVANLVTYIAKLILLIMLIVFVATMFS